MIFPAKFQVFFHQFKVTAKFDRIRIYRSKRLCSNENIFILQYKFIFFKMSNCKLPNDVITLSGTETRTGTGKMGCMKQRHCVEAFTLHRSQDLLSPIVLILVPVPILVPASVIAYFRNLVGQDRS